MTMIPKKIKGLPNLRKTPSGTKPIPSQGSSNSNRSVNAGAKMVR